MRGLLFSYTQHAAQGSSGWIGEVMNPRKAYALWCPGEAMGLGPPPPHQGWPHVVTGTDLWQRTRTKRRRL